MYDRILVPTDGSESAEAAMPEALALAAAHGAELHLLHVIDSRQYDTSIESAVEPLRRAGTRHLARLAETAGDVPVTTELAVGRPARTILSTVDECDADLIVMGTRGAGGLPRRILGSVTTYVVSHADVPVHVVPTPSGE